MNEEQNSKVVTREEMEQLQTSKDKGWGPIRLSGSLQGVRVWMRRFSHPRVTDARQGAIKAWVAQNPLAERKKNRNVSDVTLKDLPGKGQDYVTARMAAAATVKVEGADWISSDVLAACEFSSDLRDVLFQAALDVDEATVEDLRELGKGSEPGHGSGHTSTA